VYSGDIDLDLLHLSGQQVKVNMTKTSTI